EPSATFRQRMTSLFPSLVKTYSRSPTSAGVATPLPTVIFHFLVSSLGHSLGAVKPSTFASRFGPRHWGQSWAFALTARPNKAKAASQFAVFMASSEYERCDGSELFEMANPDRPSGFFISIQIARFT